MIPLLSFPNEQILVHHEIEAYVLLCIWNRPTSQEDSMIHFVEEFLLLFFHDGQEGFLVFVLSLVDGEAAMMIFCSPFYISYCVCAATKLWEECVFV
jgi:hypothetical protein